MSGVHHSGRKWGADTTCECDLRSPSLRTGTLRVIYRWALGCIGCVILVWLTKGAEGVKKFAEDRKQTTGMKIVSSFYGDKVLKPAVEELLSDSETAGGLSGKVASILRKMLNYEEEGRATANEARTLFQEANRQSTHRKCRLLPLPLPR